MEESLAIIVLIIISAVYALFDVFNKRDVPNLFVYASILIGLAITFTYNYAVILYSLEIAAAVAVLGYLLYRKGFLGGGDFLEFIAISLMLPIQPHPLLSAGIPVQIPFIISVLLAAGYVVSIYIPVYYLAKPGNKPKIEKRKAFSGIFILLSYAILIITMFALFYISAAGIIILGTLGVASAFIILYEDSIYSGMVSMAYPKELEQGDMIAINLMSRKDIGYFKRISKSFGRLVTRPMLSEIKNAKRKLPVYRNSVPFALFIFIGIIISLLFGNLMALILS